MKSVQFRLAYPTGDEYLASEHGYFRPEAARVAALTLNMARFVHHRPEYTHIAKMTGTECLEVMPLVPSP